MIFAIFLSTRYVALENNKLPSYFFVFILTKLYGFKVILFMFTEILKFYFEYHIVIVDTIKNIVIQKVIFVP